MNKLLVTSLLCLGFTLQSFCQGPSDRNVIIITMDGFRWQEVFAGADFALINNGDYTRDRAEYRDKYWSVDFQERRKKLMPFFWKTIANKGQIFGNRKFGNNVECVNPYWGSYPGYNEILTGFADDRVYTNDFPNNHNMSVLEYINKERGYENQVAAFTSWKTFDRILNKEGSTFYINAGNSKIDYNINGSELSDTEMVLNKLVHFSLENYRTDAVTYNTAFEYLKINHPKVLYIGLGDADEMAHGGRYDLYLDAAHNLDQMIKEIWEYVQTIPQYKDNTTLFLTTDHGRGLRNDWTSHGSIYYLDSSKEIWFAAMGPKIESLGEIKSEGNYYQNQFAQTIASFLNIEFKPEHPVGGKITHLFE